MGGARKLVKVLHHNRTFKRVASNPDLKQQVPTSIPQEFKTKTLEDANPVCRVCLQEGNIPIYGNEDFDDVSQDLITIAGINVQKDDDHPKHLCVSCNSLLQSAIQLRKMAQYSDQVLQPCRVKCQPDIQIEIQMSRFDIKKEYEKNKTPRENLVYKQEMIETSHHDNGDDIMDDDDIIKTSQESFVDRQKIVKTAGAENYYCNRCRIHLMTELQYRLHLLSDEHINFKETCPICHKQYDPKYIKNHMIYHNTTVSHVCEVCGKEFTVKGHFDQHRKVHTLALPYKCSLCPYRSRYNFSLTLHKRTHTGERPHACHICPRSFVNKSNLNRHLLTHKTDYEFTCDQCNHGYHVKLDLERHIKSNHMGINDYICSICGKGFGLNSKMRKHQIKVHKVKKSTWTGRKPLYLMEEFQKQTNVVDDSETEKATAFLAATSASTPHYSRI